MQPNPFFDNVQVLHYKGRLLEEQHYYPFGLTMRAGSNDPVPNRYLWQGKELQDEVGLKLYDFHARQYDPQIGRFGGIDPADQFPSGYTGMGNDPGNLIDPDGCQVSMGGGVGGYTTAGVSDMSLSDFGEHWANGTILDDTRFDHPVNSLAWGLGSIGGGGQGAGALVVYSPDPMSTGYGYYNWGSMEIPGSISPTNKISVSLDQFESMVRAPAFYAESALQSKLNSNERSGYEKANLMVGGVGVVPATIEMGTILIKNSANYTDDIARIARVTSRAGKLLGVASMTLTVVDGLTSKEGWKKHNTADLLIGGAQTFLLGAGPVGWGINIIWISADLITTGITGKSITENLFD